MPQLAFSSNTMSALFNICSSVNCVECSKEHFLQCPGFQPTRVSTLKAQKEQIDDLFGEDLLHRSILRDLDDNFLGNHLMEAVKRQKALAFLEAQVAPLLMTALMQMAQARPTNPVEWLADWLTLHDPALDERKAGK